MQILHGLSKLQNEKIVNQLQGNHFSEKPINTVKPLILAFESI